MATSAREQIKGTTENSSKGPFGGNNRFFGTFGHKWNDGLTFDAITGNGAKPKKFDKGDLAGWTQVPMADVTINVLSNGIPTGAVIPGGRVTRRISPDASVSVYCFVWPNVAYGGGNVHRSFISAKNDEHAADDLNAFADQIVGQWKLFQKDRKAKGLTKPEAMPYKMGTQITDDEAEELGLDPVRPTTGQ